MCVYLVEEPGLSGRPLQLLRMLQDDGIPISVYTLNRKQEELAVQLGISRQALNVHLRKLRDLGYIRTGRGFIDVSEEGQVALGVSVNPTFVFLKISPTNRKKAYEQILQFPIRRIFRVAGDMDVILIIERSKLDEALKKLANVDGVTDTKTYMGIQTLK